MVKKIREKISLAVIKNPRGMILATIIAINIFILIVSSFIINLFMKDAFGNAGYWKTVYYTIGMILDAGMMENVVRDVGTTSIVLVIICILVIVIGSITFTGAVIGYVTNYISSFIDNANSDSRQIHISNHTVILNWNSRASEIINDMLFLGRRETIVVLVNNNAERIRQEINERLYLTIRNEKNENGRSMKNLLNVIVREGSTYSTKQLNDISLLTAKTIIILGSDDENYICKYDIVDKQFHMKENANTIKTLVQVSEICSSDSSADDQKIIVEVEDSWTKEVVGKIIKHKERLGKCNIVPVPVNRILGQILSQFCIFPELNMVYSVLFSNKGAEFFCIPETEVDGSADEEDEFISKVLDRNPMAVPLTFMEAKTGSEFYYMATHDKDIDQHIESESLISVSEKTQLEINRDYWLENRNIIILGHNSKIQDIMAGFDAFRAEWNRGNGSEIINIMVIDDKKSLEKQNYYKDISYVNKVIEAEIYDTELIKNSINEFIDSYEEDTSILVLSDDMVQEQDIDSQALTNLVYVQDIIYERVKKDPNYDTDRIDVIVEILNPKNYDVVHNYNIDSIVISNRYISKMVTQIGEKIELFEFYEDILTYDDSDCVEYESKEVYIKPVSGFLKKYPGKCRASDLIRAIYENSPSANRSLLLGIVRPGGVVEIFEGDQRNLEVTIGKRDKLILFSNH